MRSIDILKPIEFLDIENYREETSDYLIVGTGITGLRAALEIGKDKRVTLITKSKVIETNTNYAQGGIAAVISKDDRFDLHIDDTIYAGAGLCDKESVEVLVKEGSICINDLLHIDTKFDRKENGKLSLTKEAAHSKKRILHAGDSTGAEIERSLTESVAGNKNIDIREYVFLIDILDETHSLMYDLKNREFIIMAYKAIILATGSIGMIYKNTSNPEVATGDGFAIAYRAGIELSDMEFIQFHPTTFSKEGVNSFLISEALRGEGGKLRNINGEKFMNRYTPEKELAPRDVVSRSIINEMELTDSKAVYLDMTMFEVDYLYKRFPNITEFCKQYGVDIAKEYIPVSPAAHYIMGGIKTDLNGRSNKSGIFAAGEAAGNGVHGANRLASNSLLEGLVFGKRAGENALYYKDVVIKNYKLEKKINKRELISEEEIKEITLSMRELMWKYVGVLRDEKRLKKALFEIEELVYRISEKKFEDSMIIKGLELINMLTVAYIITEAAFNRKESRGAHFRLDYPKLLNKAGKHSLIKKDNI